MSINAILNTCRGQGKVTEGRERSPKSKILFGLAAHDVRSILHIELKKFEAILQSDPMQVYDREGSDQPRVT